MGRRRDENGFVAIFAVICFSGFMFGCAALGVDVGRMYLEAQRVQKAADAAALAAVPYLPADLSGATTAGRALAKTNGYDNTGNNTVTIERGEHATEAHATVCSTIRNGFASVFGYDTVTVCRDAVADYTGPQPMGSPCNTLGNEPAGTTNAGPTASQLKIPTSATCSTNPQFWMSAAGPEVYKTQGDEYDTRVCSGNESDCTGTSNDEFNPNGYFLLVRVGANAKNKPITLQLYDPAYVSTASGCAAAPTPAGSVNADNWNTYASADAKARYLNDSNAFCTGDNDNNGLRRGAATPTVTSFGLRAPVDSGNPLEAAPVSTDCTRQYPGYAAPTAASLKSGDGTYNDNLARVFHEWVTLCQFTPAVAGDYYLQVRTNVALQGAVNFEGGYKPASTSTASIFTQSGDDTNVKGNGTNRYAVRAFGTGLNAGDVSVSAFGKMPIFANADAATTTFNLIRVLPGAAGKNLIFQFFDVGESSSSSGATLTVQRPGEATGDALTKCSATGFKTYASLSNCSISGISNSAGWDGQSEVMVVPIPTNYNCNAASAGGCWFKVQAAFGAGSTVTDATTWTASISGQPVRLLR